MTSEQMLGASMTKWSAAARSISPELLANLSQQEVERLNALPDQIDQDKLAALRAVEQLGLPRKPHIVVKLEDFLIIPDAYLSDFDKPVYFAILAPHINIKQYDRERSQVTQSEVLPFIHRSLSPEWFPDYTLILEEQITNYYGGNIVCDDNGAVSMELIAGPWGHNALISGTVMPEFTATRDLLTGNFRMAGAPNVDTPELREAAWKTIMAIPHTYAEGHADEYQSRGMQFTPGYYEFYLVRREETSPLEPMFLDYTNQPAFRLYN